MNEIANGKDTKTDREINEQKETRELASHLVGLHMDTERSEAVLGGFKEHLLERRPFHAKAIIEGMDREVRGRNANGKDIRESQERSQRGADIRELASHLVGLHMDTERSEAVLEGFKRYLRERYPLFARSLILEIDRAVSEYNAKPAE